MTVPSLPMISTNFQALVDIKAFKLNLSRLPMEKIKSKGFKIKVLATDFLSSDFCSTHKIYVEK